MDPIELTVNPVGLPTLYMQGEAHDPVLANHLPVTLGGEMGRRWKQGKSEILNESGHVARHCLFPPPSPSTIKTKAMQYQALSNHHMHKACLKKKPSEAKATLTYVLPCTKERHRVPGNSI